MRQYVLHIIISINIKHPLLDKQKKGKKEEEEGRQGTLHAELQALE